MTEIESAIRNYILERYLPGVNPDELSGTTPLMTGGVLDSLGVILLVDFIEKRFSIEIRAHETDIDHFGTIATIVQLIEGKLKQEEK